MKIERTVMERKITDIYVKLTDADLFDLLRRKSDNPMGTMILPEGADEEIKEGVQPLPKNSIHVRLIYTDGSSPLTMKKYSEGSKTGYQGWIENKDGITMAFITNEGILETNPMLQEQKYPPTPSGTYNKEF